MVPWGQANAKTPMFKHEFTPYTLLIHTQTKLRPSGMQSSRYRWPHAIVLGCFALYNPFVCVRRGDETLTPSQIQYWHRSHLPDRSNAHTFSCALHECESSRYRWPRGFRYQLRMVWDTPISILAGTINFCTKKHHTYHTLGPKCS